MIWYELIDRLLIGASAIAGALFCLIISNDINPETKEVKLDLTLLGKLAYAFFLGLGTEKALINIFHFNEHWKILFTLFGAIFGYLFTGILYQALQVYRGKSFKEIIDEFGYLKTLFCKRCPQPQEDPLPSNPEQKSTDKSDGPRKPQESPND